MRVDPLHVSGNLCGSFENNIPVHVPPYHKSHVPENQITVGIVTNNPQLTAQGAADLAGDTIALLVPGWPAGATKVLRLSRTGKVGKATLQNGTEVTLQLSKMRRAEALKNTSVISGREFQESVTNTIIDDVAATNIKVIVKCDGMKLATAEIDLLLKNRQVYELKNYGYIDQSLARSWAGQVGRQHEVIHKFGGQHGGIVVRDSYAISDTAAEAFKDRGILILEKSKFQASLSLRVGD